MKSAYEKLLPQIRRSLSNERDKESLMKERQDPELVNSSVFLMKEEPHSLLIWESEEFKNEVFDMIVKDAPMQWKLHTEYEKQLVKSKLRQNKSQLLDSELVSLAKKKTVGIQSESGTYAAEQHKWKTKGLSGSTSESLNSKVTCRQSKYVMGSGFKPKGELFSEEESTIEQSMENNKFRAEFEQMLQQGNQFERKANDCGEIASGYMSALVK